MLLDRHFILIPKAVYQEHVESLLDFDFVPDENKEKTVSSRSDARDRASAQEGREVGIKRRPLPAPEKADRIRGPNWDAVKRWFIMMATDRAQAEDLDCGGISVFLHYRRLPEVKRVFALLRSASTSSENAISNMADLCFILLAY